MMAHLHMTKDAVNNDQDKREGGISAAEKKSTEPPNTGKICTYYIYKMYKVYLVSVSVVSK